MVALIGFTASQLSVGFVFGANEATFDLRLAIGSKRDEGAAAGDILRIEDVGPVIEDIQFVAEFLKPGLCFLGAVGCLAYSAASLSYSAFNAS